MTNSAIYSGIVRHRRFSPKPHNFNYPLYMLVLDVDEIEQLGQQSWLFSDKRWAPLRIKRQDYLDGADTPLRPAIVAKLEQLGANTQGIDTIMMLCQARCFGVYFSPINVYFCYIGAHAKYMLTEVNNTPWGERHFYLVDLDSPNITPKEFHVSPFMGMDMDYHWDIKPPVLGQSQKPIRIHIALENKAKIFDATLTMTGQKFEAKALGQILRRWPIMTFQILRGIYWQAVRLFIKSIPYVAHSRR